MKTEMNFIGLKYADLNKTQKRIVDALVQHDPTLATANTITRKHLEKLHWKMMDERSTGGPKLGWPNWMVRGEKIDRATYPFPGPQAEPLSTPAVKPRAVRGVKTSEKLIAARVVANKKAEEEFFKDLEEFGVEI